MSSVITTIIPPTLPQWAVDVIVSVVTISYGLRVECHYTPWISVVLNIITGAVFLGSNPLPLLVWIVLISYVLIGLPVAKFKVKKLYSFFGTKTIGALALTGLIQTTGFFDWLSSILNPMNSFFEIATIFLITWLILGTIIHIIGWYYFGRRKC